MEDQQILLKSKIHHITFNNVISRLRYNTSYTDVTLACNGKFYLVHKLVLAISSKYFSDILEITECNNSMIILTGIKSSDLEMLLDYMYTGEVSVRKNDMNSLVQAAAFLRINSLASRDEEPESLSSSVSKKQSPILNVRRSSESRSTDLGTRRSCTSSVRNLKDSKKKGEIYPILPIQIISFENNKEANGISTTNDREDDSDIEILSATEFPDNLQTTLEEDEPMSMSDYNGTDLQTTMEQACPLPISDYNSSELGGSTVIKNNANLPSCVRYEPKRVFAESLSGATAEKQSPPLKMRRTDEGRTPGYSSGSSVGKLVLDPKSSLYYRVHISETLPVNNRIPVENNYEGIPVDDNYKGTIICNNDNCNQGFNTLDNFRVHLVMKHGEKHPRIELSFKNREDVEKWKLEFEDENEVNFRLKKSEKKQKIKVTYYQCNRSSCFMRKCEATGKRKPKSSVKNGPSQISTLCTSGFKLVEKEGLFHITAYPTHAGHPLDNKHKQCLRLPEVLKDEYIKQIQMGVSLSIIIGGIDEEVKKQYGISWNKLYHLKKSLDEKTGTPTEKSALPLPDSNDDIESVTLHEL